MPLFQLILVGDKIILPPLRNPSVTPQQREAMAVRVQDLYSFVTPIRHIDEPIRVHRHARGAVKLAFSRSRHAPAGHMCPLGIELLNAIIAPIGYVDLILRVRGNAPGQVKLPCSPAVTPPLS